LESKDSSRRSFIRRLLGLVAVSGFAASFYEWLGKKPLMPPVHAQTPMYVDQTNTGSGTTTLISPAYESEAFKVVNADITAFCTAIKGQAGHGYTFGVFGQTDGTGIGVIGKAPHHIHDASTCGVYGESTASMQGVGVHGRAAHDTGPTRGIYGESNSTGGTGVQGHATATTGSTKAYTVDPTQRAAQALQDMQAQRPARPPESMEHLLRQAARAYMDTLAQQQAPQPESTERPLQRVGEAYLDQQPRAPAAH